MPRVFVLLSLLLGSIVLGPTLNAVAQEVASTPGASGEASPYLVGDALPLLPPGEPGAMAVVAVGAPVKWHVPVVLRNNTDETVVLATVRGTAHDAAGAPLATGEPGSFLAPSVLPPGQVAIAAVYFNSLEHLPADAVLAFEVEFEPPATAQVFRQDLEIVEATREEDSIVGIVRNGTGAPLVGRVSVLGVCVDASGAVRGYYEAFADKNDLDPGETAPFDARFGGTGPCEAFLVGASGYQKP